MTARRESEVDLCLRIRDWAERLGFEVYPEIAGWDLVLVASSRVHLGSKWRGRYGDNVEPGHQVGIHAKLRPSCELLTQAMPPQGRIVSGWHYPHLPFVAAPSPGEGFRLLAQRLGIGVVDTDPKRRMPKWAREDGGQPDPAIMVWPTHDHGAREMAPLDLPPIASRSIQAGSPSPRQLSPWRVGALRFLAFARGAETFTIADLARFGVNRNWADRWGKVIETRSELRRGRAVRVNVYRLTDDTSKLPDAGYKDVAAELLAADTPPLDPNDAPGAS